MCTLNPHEGGAWAISILQMNKLRQREAKAICLRSHSRFASVLGFDGRKSDPRACIFKPQYPSASHEGGVMKMTLMWSTEDAFAPSLWLWRLPILSFPLPASPLRQPHLCIFPESNPPAQVTCQPCALTASRGCAGFRAFIWLAVYIRTQHRGILGPSHVCWSLSTPLVIPSLSCSYCMHSHQGQWAWGWQSKPLLAYC